MLPIKNLSDPYIPVLDKLAKVLNTITISIALARTYLPSITSENSQPSISLATPLLL